MRRTRSTDSGLRLLVPQAQHEARESKYASPPGPSLHSGDSFWELAAEGSPLFTDAENAEYAFPPTLQPNGSMHSHAVCPYCSDRCCMQYARVDTLPVCPVRRVQVLPVSVPPVPPQEPSHMPQQELPPRGPTTPPELALTGASNPCRLRAVCFVPHQA